MKFACRSLTHGGSGQQASFGYFGLAKYFGTGRSSRQLVEYGSDSGYY